MALVGTQGWGGGPGVQGTQVTSTGRARGGVKRRGGRRGRGGGGGGGGALFLEADET